MAGRSGIKAGSAWVEIGAKLEGLDKGLKGAQKKLQNFAGGARALGMAAGGFGLGMLAPLALASKEFMDFEHQMAQVSTMLDRPQDHMDRFAAGIKALAVETGKSTADLANAMTFILGSDVAPENALDVLAASAKGAVGGLTETLTMADGLTTVLNSYKMSATQATRVTDILFNVAKYGKITMEDLAGQIGDVANIAATTKIPLEEVGAMISLLTINGVPASEAMTQINGVLNSFLSPAKEAAEVAAQHGLALNSQTLAAGGLLGVMQKLQGLPPDVLGQIFPNIRALKGVLPALGDIAKFKELIGQMQNSAGAAETAYMKMWNTITTQLQRATQAAKLLAVQIGSALQGPLTMAMETGLQWLETITLIVKENPHLVRQTLAMALGLIAVGGALIGVSAAATAASWVFGSLAGIISFLTGTFSMLFGVIGTVVSVLATPFAAAVAVGLVLGTVLAKLTGNMDELRGMVSELAGTPLQALNSLMAGFRSLRDTAVASWQGIADALKAGDLAAAGRILWLALKMEWAKGVSALMGIWRGFKETFGAFMTETTAVVGGGIVKGVLALNRTWHNAVNFISDAWTGLMLTLAETWDGFMEAIRNGWIEIRGLTKGEDWVVKQKTELSAEMAAKAGARQTDTSAAMNARAAKLDEMEREDRVFAGLVEAGAIAEHQARQARLAAEEKAERDKIAGLKEEWQEAIAQAGAKAVAIDIDRALTDFFNGVRETLTDDVVKAGEQGMKKTETVADNWEVRGTFSSAALFGLAVGTTLAERAAKAAEQTAQNTKRIAENQNNTELAFS